MRLTNVAIVPSIDQHFVIPTLVQFIVQNLTAADFEDIGKAFAVDAKKAKSCDAVLQLAGGYVDISDFPRDQLHDNLSELAVAMGASAEQAAYRKKGEEPVEEIEEPYYKTITKGSKKNYERVLAGEELTDEEIVDAMKYMDNVRSYRRSDGDFYDAIAPHSPMVVEAAYWFFGHSCPALKPEKPLPKWVADGLLSMFNQPKETGPNYRGKRTMGCQGALATYFWAPNASPAVIREVIEHDGDMIQYAKEQTEELCLLAIENGAGLNKITNQTDRVVFAALGKNGCALEYVEKQKREHILAAVKNKSYALAKADEDLIDDEIVDIAIAASGTVMQYVPKKFWNKTRRLKACESDGWCAHWLMAEGGDMSDEEISAAIRSNPHSVMKVPRLTLADFEAGLQTEKGFSAGDRGDIQDLVNRGLFTEDMLVLLAKYKHPMAEELINKYEHDVIVRCLEHDGSLFKSVRMAKTAEMCIAAVCSYPEVIEKVPKKFREGVLR